MKPPISYHKAAKDKDVMMGLQTFKDHQGMAERLKKTLYYGKHPKTDRPSLPMTELAVEFFSKAVPEGLGKIDMDYATTVSRNACISPCSMILAMAYIERLRCRSPDYLMQVSSSDLFLVSMMVASKFLYDEGEDDEVFNEEWAASANLDNKEVNQLERHFLRAIDWNVYMNPNLYEDLLNNVEYKIAIRKSKDRGWCTYTDLLVLSNYIKAVQCWQLLLDSVIKVVAISSIAYAASAAAMVGAVMLARHTTLHRTQIISDETMDKSAFIPHLGSSSINESASFSSFDNLTQVQCMFCDHSVYGSLGLNTRLEQTDHYQNSYISTPSSGLHNVNSHLSLSFEILGPMSESELPCYSSCLESVGASYFEKSYFECCNEYRNLFKKLYLTNSNRLRNRLESDLTNDVIDGKICNKNKNSSKLLPLHRARSKTVCIETTGFAYK